MPAVDNPLQLVLPRVLERESRPRDEILDGLGNENLRGARLSLVVRDHAREGRKFPQERHAVERLVPLEVDVARPIRLPDDVERSPAQRLIREVDAIGRRRIRVSGLSTAAS